MSALAIVAIVVGVIVVLFFIGGLLGVRARERRDRGWNRDRMEAAAREAVAGARPGWSYDDLHLVLVDDRPGTEEDRAHFVAMGPDDQVRVILARRGDDWVLEQVAD